MENLSALPFRDDQRADGAEFALVEMAQSNPDGFSQLYECYLPRIYRYLRVRSANDEVAADLTRLHALLGGLDSDKRELLELRFAAQLSSREIALVVGKSEAAVKKQLTRTIQTLRRQYLEE